MSNVKGTQGQPAPLTIGAQTVIVPPHTRIIFNLNALHTHPRYWGEDALEWKPSRWIQATSGDGSVHNREQMVMPDHGAYLPWGEGNRACPGKKFAQVEHVAVMVAMFRDHSVATMRRNGENKEAARKRAEATLKDTGMLLLLQMLHPEKTPLRWQEQHW
jgi:cytochrome P450